MKPNQLFDELSEIAKNLGYRIRKETGNFKSNNCIVKQEKIIILNKFANINSYNKTLVAAIKQEDYEKIFIKPQVREFIESLTDTSELISIFEQEIKNP
jgi:hypothetical protein